MSRMTRNAAREKEGVKTWTKSSDERELEK